MKVNNTFTSKVYELTKKISKGKVATYGQIAKQLGSPNAARAVGMCLSTNTDSKAVPCHRVVASDGNLTGYAFGGISKKRIILEKEGVKFKGDKVDLSVSLFKF